MPSTDQDFIAAYLAQSAQTMAQFAADAAAAALLADMASRVVAAMRAGGKLLIAGNGGSAGDAQHIAAEFVSRLMYDRAPLPAIALTTDSSALTAIGNDYGFDQAFARQVQALGRPGDAFLGISTSGNSPNILAALGAARQAGLLTLGFAGQSGGKMVPHTDLLFRAQATSAALIQQLHITAGHVLCALVERAMFPQPATA